MRPPAARGAEPIQMEKPMSGGSMNYLYSRLLSDATFPANTPERRAFRDHLALVSQALHDIEWVDSGDYGCGRENPAIARCVTAADVLVATVQHAERALDDLSRALRAAKPLRYPPTSRAPSDCSA